MASPQVDVIVLHPSYPPQLRDKNLYLAGGVAAAFECKLTLKSAHVREAIDNCMLIKRLVPNRTGTPYLELNSPILYGLLAHSHIWQGGTSTPIANVTKIVQEADPQITQHPREMLDLICVADLATWGLHKHPYHPINFPHIGGKCTTVYIPWCSAVSSQETLSPIGGLLLAGFKKLAWEDQRLRRLAEYFSLTSTQYGNGEEAKPRVWEPSTIYTEKLMDTLEIGFDEYAKRNENVYGSPGGLWNEWRLESDNLVDVTD